MAYSFVDAKIDYDEVVKTGSDSDEEPHPTILQPSSVQFHESWQMFPCISQKVLRLGEHQYVVVAHDSLQLVEHGKLVRKYVDAPDVNLNDFEFDEYPPNRNVLILQDGRIAASTSPTIHIFDNALNLLFTLNSPNDEWVTGMIELQNGDLFTIDIGYEVCIWNLITRERKVLTKHATHSYEFKNMWHDIGAREAEPYLTHNLDSDIVLLELPNQHVVFHVHSQLFIWHVPTNVLYVYELATTNHLKKLANGMLQFKTGKNTWKIDIAVSPNPFVNHQRRTLSTK